MRRMILATVLVTAPGFWSEAPAQAPTVDSVMHEMIVLGLNARACGVHPTRAQRRTVDELGRELDSKAPLNEEAMQAALEKAKAELPPPDCAVFVPGFAAELDRVVALGRQVR